MKTTSQTPMERPPRPDDCVTIGHLSDLHVAPGDENTVLAKKAMRHKQLDDVDLVVVTGDVVDSTSVEHQSSGLGVLASRPSSQPVLVVPGNHDVSSRGWRVAGVDDSLRAEFSQLSLRSGVARQLSPNRPWPVQIGRAHV